MAAPIGARAGLLVLKGCMCGMQVAVSCRPPGSTPKPTGRRQQGSARDTGSQTEMPPIDIDAVSNGDTVDGVVVRFCLECRGYNVDSSRHAEVLHGDTCLPACQTPWHVTCASC